MNESELEAWLSQCVDSIRRAFREVGRKGAEAHGVVVGYLDRAMVELGKIRREEVSAQDVIAEENELDQKVRDYVRKAPTSNRETILKKLYASPVTVALMDKQEAMFARRGHSAFVAERIAQEKRKQPDDPRQTYFDFRKAPEFHAVPQWFVYTDPDSGKPVKRSLAESLEKDWVQAIRQCEKTREVLHKANKILEPLRKLYGDLPPQELWANKLRDDKKRGRSA